LNMLNTLLTDNQGYKTCSYDCYWVDVTWQCDIEKLRIDHAYLLTWCWI